LPKLRALDVDTAAADYVACLEFLLLVGLEDLLSGFLCGGSNYASVKFLNFNYIKKILIHQRT
jgi:hypothetical protein